MHGDAGAQSRLRLHKRSLEVDRSIAFTAKESLAKDVAAEPSMLSELPKVNGTNSASDPIQVTDGAASAAGGT